MDHHYHRISATKSDGVGQGKLYSPDHAIKVATKLDENVGQVQGDLYSPDHAIKIATSPEEEKLRMLGMKSLATVKDKVLEKLAAAAEKEAINGDEEEDERKPKASSRDGSAGELPFSKL